MPLQFINGKYTIVPALRVAEKATPGAGFEEDTTNTLKELGLKGLSGIGMIGNTLDVVGGTSRDLLAGKMPWKDWEGITTGEGRTTGRELLTKWGLAKPNDPDKWEWADFAGFAAEVATDPLTYFSPLALTKAGNLVKSAGLLDEVPRVAAKTLGVGSGATAIKVGKETVRNAAPGWIKSRMMTTIGDIIHHGPEDAATRIANAAADRGIELTDDILKQNVGGLFGFGLPGAQPTVFGKSSYLGTEYSEAGLKAARMVKRISGPNRQALYKNMALHGGKDVADQFMPLLDMIANRYHALGGYATPDDYYKTFKFRFGSVDDLADMPDALLQGRNIPRSKIDKVRSLAKEGLNGPEIAKRTGLGTTTVSAIMKGSRGKAYYGATSFGPEELNIVDSILRENPNANGKLIADKMSELTGAVYTQAQVSRGVKGTKYAPRVISAYNKMLVSKLIEDGSTIKDAAKTAGIPFAAAKSIATRMKKSGLTPEKFRWKLSKEAPADIQDGLDHLLYDLYKEIQEEMDPGKVSSWDDVFQSTPGIEEAFPKYADDMAARDQKIIDMPEAEFDEYTAMRDQAYREAGSAREHGVEGAAKILGVGRNRLRTAIERHTKRLKETEGRLFQQHTDQFGPKAAFHVAEEDGKRIITLFEKADVSSFVHEIGHMFWDDMRKFGDDKLMKEASKAIGVDEAIGWTEANHEAFARGFERYMRDGVAPTASLRSVFDKFRSWLIGIYEVIVGTPLEKKVSPQLRQVFDTMLGGGIGTGTAVYKPTGLEKVAGALEAVGGSIRWSKPGMLAANVFDASTGDRGSKFTQLAHKSLHRAQNEGTAYAKKEFARHVQSMVDNNKLTQAHGDILREYSEGVRDLMNAPGDEQVLANIAMQAQEAFVKMKEVSDDYGIPLEELEDAWVDYFPRYISESLGGATGKGGKPLVAFDPSQLKREDALRNIKGGTARINKIVNHFKQDEGARELLRKGGVDEVVSHIRQQPELADSFDVPGFEVPGFAQGPVPSPFSDKQAKAFVKYLKKVPDEVIDSGTMFGNHPLVDMAYRIENHKHAVASAEAVIEMMADPSLHVRGLESLTEGRGAVSFNDIFNTSKLVQGDLNRGAMQKLARRMGKTANTTKELKAFFDQRWIPADEAEQIRRMIDGFTTPKPIGTVMEMFDSATNLFKAGVTSIWPAFHTRNLVSGQFQNWLTGQFSAASVSNAHKVMRGKSITGLRSIPSIARRMAEEGLDNTDEAATDLVRRMAFEHQLVHRYQGLQDADVPITSTIGAGGINRDFAGGLGGQEPFDYRGMARKALGIHEDVVPLHKSLKGKVRGVGKATESTVGPVAAGEDAGHIVEAMNRLAPFLHNLKKGMDPAEAARRVKAAQVDYSAREFTKTERAFFKRVFPFYSFSSRIAKNTFQQLATRPGGRLAQTLRATNKGTAASVATPDYVAQTLSIPVDNEGYLGKVLGKPPEGTDRYITGIGMMHEDPLSLVSNTVEGSIVELLSRSNPAIKGVLEWGTGQSFFQRGPLGGRPIEDLDPTIARTISNFGEMFGGERVAKPKPFMNRAVEFVAANSPFARFLTSARVATDPRKSLLARAVNLMTGARISDISPGAKDAIIKEALEKLMKYSGASSFNRIYFSKADKAKMSPEERAFAEELQTLINALAQRAKDRKEAATAIA